MRRIFFAALAAISLLALPASAAFSPGRPFQRISGAGAVGANATAYLGASSPQTFANATPYLINQPCVVTRVYIEFTVAPGASNTFTFTLYRAGNPISGATTSATGASTYAASFSPNVQMSDKDNLELQVATSSGAPAATFRFYIETQ